MNALDMRTVVILDVITYIIGMLFMVQLWRQSRNRFDGIAFWVFAYALQTAALILIVLRGTIPDLISIVVANTFVLAGALLIYIGLERFFEKIGTQLHNYILIALCVASLIYFTFIHPDLPLRIFILSAGLLIISFQCLWLLLYRVELSMRPLTFLAGMVFGGHCIVSIFRMVEYFVGVHGRVDLFQSGAFQTFALVSYMMLLIMLTYSLVLMVNKRLLNQIGTQEEKFAKVFRTAPYAIMLTRLSDGTVIDVNESFVVISGYDRAEVLGKKTMDLHLWENSGDRAAVVEILSRTGKVKGMDLRFRKKNGETFTGLFSAETVLIVGEKSILCSIADITDRKHAEETLRKAHNELEQRVSDRTEELMRVNEDLRGEIADRKHAEVALRESEQRFHALAECAPVGIYIADQDGACKYVNRRWCEAAGLSPEEAYGQGWVNGLHPDDRATIGEKWKQSMLSNGFWGFEYRFQNRTGQVTWVYGTAAPLYAADGTVTEYVGTNIDITERKQAEEARQAKEEILQSLFNAISESACLIDCNGEVLSANEIFARRLGKQVNDCIGRSIYSLIPSALAANRKAIVEKVVHTGQPVTFEDERLGRRISHSLSPVFAKNGTVDRIAIYATDITERVLAEETMRNAAQEWSTSFDAMPDGVSIHAGDHTIVRVNRTLCRLLGKNEAELIGRKCYDIFHGADHPVASCPIELSRKTKKKEYAELFDPALNKWLSISSSPIFAESGQVTRLVHIVRDITDRKRADEALRDSEEKHRKIVEALSDAVLLRSGEIIIYANPAALKLFRANHPEELTGKRYLDLVHPDDRALSAERMKKNTGESWIESPREHRVLALDGQVVHVESVGVPIKYRGEVQVFGVFRDITNRKRAEEERTKLQDQLIQLQKMESVGRLAGGVAHDFNNMLGVILGHTEMAMEQVDPAVPLHAELQEIRKAANRSADLTQQLLAFARKQVVSPKVLDLNETVTGMLKMLRRLIGEDIQLAWLPGAELWPVKMDPSQIDQILANLSVNARDAIAGVGKVTIETQNIRIDETYCTDPAGSAFGEFVELAVSDDGCGMDKETIGKLFEPFFTTKGVGKGTGLGLATVYGIVKQNGGFIQVYSEPGQGTTFKIHLPRDRGKAEQEVTEGTQKSVMPGHETVLVAEDEPALLKLNRLMLEKQGYGVLAAGSPGEAIRLAEEHAGEIHLLLTDVVMPEMNGQELAKKILSLYPNLKHLFMSGYTADVIAHRGILDDRACFIQKPFSRKELLAKVREALDQK